jgi:hypothetical protein
MPRKITIEINKCIFCPYCETHEKWDSCYYRCSKINKFTEVVEFDDYDPSEYMNEWITKYCPFPKIR